MPLRKTPDLNRITANPGRMGGKPCIRDLRITVSTITGLLASGASPAEILELYPHLEADDINAALAYASWRSGEYDMPIPGI